MNLTDEQLQAIIDREYRGLAESGLGFSALDVIDEMALELLMLRQMQKVD